MWLKGDVKQCAHQFLRVFYTHAANMNNHLLKPEHTYKVERNENSSNGNFYEKKKLDEDVY